ncbi:MAG: hypothetical protein WBN86_10175 [Porticoccaceae bacterium]
MHAARLAHSARLQRVAALLADGRRYSTLEIVLLAAVCAVNSCIAELRANGVPIRCWREGDVWYYQQEQHEPER